MAARKGLGTIQGAHGSMTILQNDSSFGPGETLELVRIQNLVGDSFKRVDSIVLRQAIETSLSEAGYLQGSNADVVMLVQITEFTNRPAKKELKLNVELSRSGEGIAAAEITADLNGFGSEDSVAQALGRACVRFIKEISRSL